MVSTSLENSLIRWKLLYPKNLDSRNSLNPNVFLGWLMGLEPTATGITMQHLYPFGCGHANFSFSEEMFVLYFWH